MNQRELGGWGCTNHRFWRSWGSRQWWLSQTTRWVAEFGVLALSLVMLVQTMLCDASVGDLECVWQWWSLRDLPHTCTCTWCCIQRDSGNKIMALLVLRTRELWNLFKLNFTLTMRLTLAILGWPPGRALFNVKSRTLRVLTTVFLLMKTQCCHHGNSSHFFIGQDARIHTNSKIIYELRKELTSGYSHTSPPHLEFTKLQVYGVQVSFCSCSSSRHIEVL